MIPFHPDPGMCLVTFRNSGIGEIGLAAGLVK